MSKIVLMVKTKDGYEPIGERVMEVSTTQIEFLARCISSASKDGFSGVDVDLISSALYEFGFTKEDIEQLGIGYSLDNVMVEKKLTYFFIKKSRIVTISK